MRSHPLLAIAFLVSATLIRADDARWIETSNAHAQVLLEAEAKLSPEAAASRGLTGYDDRITDLSAGFEERARIAYTAAREELARRLAKTSDARVRQDLEILLKSADNALESAALGERLLVPYAHVPQLIYFGQAGLLDDQVEATRRPSALARLRRYTGLEPGTNPITELAKERFLAKSRDAALLRPFRGQVESHLASIPHFARGIRELHAKHGLDRIEGASAALKAMEAQLEDYADWLRTTVLPAARTDPRLPPEIYANNLENYGLDIPPEQLIPKAQLAYGEIRREMQALAALIARERGLEKSDYPAVIRELKKAQLGKAEVESYYREVIGHLEAIIRRERIVSLPERPMRMRLATDAENAAQPAPHFRSPPLAGGTKEQGVFILTSSNPTAEGKSASFDDFTFKAGAWTLAAHEGRPGHDLQFTSMLERGVSLARSIFAFNSVNAEGWALYAEAEVKPHEPLDAQLIALQHRLMRACRAFLDPMLNLGLMSRDRAYQVLTEDACLSPAMANQELDRYLFRMPGQATAYFYGYTRLVELRAATEIALGARFDRQAFNDFIIGQGLLPPNMMAKAVEEEFVRPARKNGL